MNPSLKISIRAVFGFIVLSVAYGRAAQGGDKVAHGKHIIFDVGTALLKTNDKAVLRHIAKLDGAKAYWEYGSRLGDVIRKTMSEVFALGEKCLPVGENTPLDVNGQPLAQLWQSLLKGEVSAAAARDTVMKRSAIYSGYSSKAHRNITEAILGWYLNPVYNAEAQIPVQPMLALFKEVVANNPRANIYLVCNYEPETYELVAKRPDLGDIFGSVNSSHIHTSGKHKLLKPDRAFFQMLLQEHNIDPTNAILIDGQKESIAQAHRLGLTALQYTEDTIPEIRRRLQDLGVLPENRRVNTKQKARG